MAAALVCAFTLAGCDGGSEPRPEEVPDLGFPLFAPVLDDARPTSSAVGPDRVSSDYGSGVTLVQLRAPSGDLCAALQDVRLAGDACTETGSEVTTSMEEMSGVGLVREGTLLYWGGLVTEADPDLLTRAADALRDAPRAEDDDLGRLSEADPASEGAEAPASEPEVQEQPATPKPAPVSADDFDRAAAMDVVRHLAGTIGPREATSRSYARAADWVGSSFERLGYDVGRQRIDVPAGTSWLGDPVAAGRSVNVVATPPGFDGTEPHLVVGAHLDTVARAPGAEDNASGVGVVLAAAAVVAEGRTRLPVVFVAFGAEEPRGGSDDDHHYGSRTYVATLGPAERRAVRAMVSLDRVGVGAQVPVGSAYDTDPVQRSLLAAGRRAGVATIVDVDQRSSDHWSFVRAGLPGARLGSTSYAAYHSASDLPSVVSPAQVERTGRLLLAWLAPR